MLLGVSSLFVILRSFSVIYRPNTLRFRILSAHLSSTAPDNSPLRGSNKSPQLKLVRTKFTEALLSFGNDISRKFTYSIEPNIVCQRFFVGIAMVREMPRNTLEAYAIRTSLGSQRITAYSKRSFRSS